MPARTPILPSPSLRDALKHLQGIGARNSADILAEQIWYTKRFLGLRADLRSIPDTPPATVPLTMIPVESETFDGFAREAERVTSTDYAQVLLRQRLCLAGIPSLYVAFDDTGEPMYAQWLTRARDQSALQAHSPGRYPPLWPSEVLLEGAYTFVSFRRIGAMRDGMAQLLRIAAAEGSSSALTYVETHNVPSLRGCAGVGFRPDHVRASVRRFGRRKSETRAAEQDELELWDLATRH